MSSDPTGEALRAAGDLGAILGEPVRQVRGGLYGAFAYDPHAERKQWADTLPQEAHQTPAVDSERLIAMAQASRVATWLESNGARLTAADRLQLCEILLHRGDYDHA